MRARTLIVSALAAGMLVLALTQITAYALDEPLSTFTRDFQITADVPWYTGSVSVLNGMVWAAVSALCFFAAWLIPPDRARLLAFGGFVVVLAADDALLLHDAVGPSYGIPPEAFMAAYAVVAVVLSWWMLQGLTPGAAAAYLGGGALLGVSAIVDQLFGSDARLPEEGAKLLGALVWLTVPLIASKPWKDRLANTTTSARYGEAALEKRKQFTEDEMEVVPAARVLAARKKAVPTPEHLSAAESMRTNGP